jgi:ABC-type branched-subunit amino acid transport system substrate-binding protein
LRQAAVAPTLDALATVAALQQVAAARDLAGRNDLQALRGALERPTQTVLGALRFDPDGDARAQLWWLDRLSAAQVNR